jgi:hypothetical protein
LALLQESSQKLDPTPTQAGKYTSKNLFHVFPFIDGSFKKTECTILIFILCVMRIELDTAIFGLKGSLYVHPTNRSLAVGRILTLAGRPNILIFALRGQGLYVPTFY